jgi:hypothetical protein
MQPFAIYSIWDDIWCQLRTVGFSDSVLLRLGKCSGDIGMPNQIFSRFR